MDASKQPVTTGKKQVGQWHKGQSGNPAGRPHGARNKSTLLVQALLDGEAEALGRKIIEMAFAGDITALRLCLERILPPRRDMLLRLDLPTIETAADIVRYQSALLNAVSVGDITPQEASSLATTGDILRKSIETESIERRLAALENAKNPIYG